MQIVRPKGGENSDLKVRPAEDSQLLSAPMQVQAPVVVPKAIKIIMAVGGAVILVGLLVSRS